MHFHNVINVIPRTFDPVIKLTQFAGGLVVGDGGDPGHEERLSVGGVEWRAMQINGVVLI